MRYLTFLKYLPLIPLVLFFYYIGRVSWFGILLRLAGKPYPLWMLNRKMSNLSGVTWTFFIFLGSIVLITFLPHTPRNESAYHVHLFFAFAALLMLGIARFWVTGVKYPKYHKWVVRSFYLFISIATVLGILRIFQM